MAISILEVVKNENVTDRPISLRKVAQENHLGVKTLRTLAASHDMAIKWLFTGAQAGHLGMVTGPARRLDTGEYKIDTQFGFLTKHDNGPAEAFGRYLINVTLEGVKVFGTEDPSGEDEPYMIVSVFSILPGSKQLVKTHMPEPKEHVRANSVIWPQEPISESLQFGGAGLNISVQLLDRQEAGSPEEAKEKIHNGIKVVAVTAGGIAGGAIGGFAGAGPFSVPGAIIGAAGGGSAALGILQIKAVDDVIGFLSGLLADAISDDLIGDKTFAVKPEELKAWSTPEGFRASRITDDNFQRLTFNVPRDQPLFNENGATYKVYFTVSVEEVNPYHVENVI